MVPVHISREQCIDSNQMNSSPTDNQEVKNVTWIIAFSGKTPGELVAQSTFQIDSLEVNDGRNMSATEYEMGVNQNGYVDIGESSLIFPGDFRLTSSM